MMAEGESDQAKTLEGGEEISLGSHKIQGMETTQGIGFESDPMETTQGDEEAGIGSSASKNNLREDSPSTPLNLGRLQVPENVSPRIAMGREHILMEIFAINISEKEDPLDEILDENLILTTHHNQSEYILYDVSGDKRIKLNSEGHLIIQWPDRGIEIKDLVTISPCYDPTSDIKLSQPLWSTRMSEYFDCTDCFTRQYLETTNCFMEFNFAVYTDGLGAMIDVTLSNFESLGLPLAVYGTVTTSNSDITHPQAKSFLFDRKCTDDGFVAHKTHPPTGEAELSLPLSRRMTAIPRQSNLIVDIHLFVQDISIANGSVIFYAETRSNTIAEEQIIVGNFGKVKVKVTWMVAVDVAKEEDDGGSAKEQEYRALDDDEKKWVEEENDEESVSGFLFDDDDSFRSLKSRRLNMHEDISTRINCQSAKEGEDGGSAKEVENWQQEKKEVWYQEENDVENEGDVESKFEFVSDNSCLNIQEVISTSSYDYCMKENVVMENNDGDQDASLYNKPHRRYKKTFLEVFSVRIVGPGNAMLDEIYGFVMIDAASSSRLLFRRERGDLPKINSQGFLLLEGPKQVAWSIYDEVFIVPFLFKYQNFDFVNEENCAHDLWNEKEYDKVLCKTLSNEVGDIEVTFAVYEDGAEAHLYIMLMDNLFSSTEVYGTITATNLKLQDPRASSTVFNKEELKHVEECVGSSEEVALPLSRPIITLPFGSTLLLDFNLYARGKPIFVRPVKFSAQLGTSVEILSGNGCSVKIEVDFFAGFFDKKPREFGCKYEGYF